MKSSSWLCVGLLVWRLTGLAQGVDPLAPSSVTPKSYRPEKSGARSAELPRSPRRPEGAQPLIPGVTIKGVVIVKTQAEIRPDGTTATGLVVRDIPFLAGADFRRLVERYLGRPLTENTIRDLEDDIILYCREKGKLLVDLILPEQNIENGVLQLWLLEGRVDKITVRNDEPRWFKDALILRNIRLRSGSTLDARRLMEDLNWLNNNPFRQVDVTFRQGGKTGPRDAGKLGLTDVEVTVEDRLPVRPYFGYENSGTRFTGEDRLLAGFNWGNVLGLDHQLNYQYAADVDFDLVSAHSASYLAPLPWRHTLLAYGSYVDGKADFSSIGSATTAEGTSWQASARYVVPLPGVGKLRHDASAGFDFKRSDNDLLFGGTNVLQQSKTDVAQFALGYSGLLPDKWGRTTFAAELCFSPGDLTDDNDDASFGKMRTGASASYFYARLNAERVTRLPYEFAWVLRGWGQVATERLLPSEQFALGGYNTVRGYDERVALGDLAWMLSNELRTPSLHLGNLLGLPGGADQVQFLAFFDYGEVRQSETRPEDGADPDKLLCSAGLGLRWTVSRHFSLRFDYGFALSDRELTAHDSRGHVAMLLSF